MLRRLLQLASIYRKEDVYKNFHSNFSAKKPDPLTFCHLNPSDLMQIHSFRFSFPFFCLSILHSPLEIIQFKIVYGYFASSFDFFPLYFLVYKPNIRVRIFWSLSGAENTEQYFFLKIDHWW